MKKNKMYKPLMLCAAASCAFMISTASEIKTVQLWAGGPYFADRNVGANSPSDFGYYFWWGDTLGYYWSGNEWVASDGSSHGFNFYKNNSKIYTFGKNTSALKSAGWITSTFTLTASHDAATVHWGANWRMPTSSELTALCEKCDWTWTQLDGVYGQLVRGRGAYSNSSIFLPACGSGKKFELDDPEDHAYYASSQTKSGFSEEAGALFFDWGEEIELDYYDRYRGWCVRPVVGTASGSGNSGETTTAGSIFKSSYLGSIVDSNDSVVGIVELKVGKINKKKATSKISATVTGMDGKKKSAKAVTVSGVDGASPITVALAVKGWGTMTVTIGEDGFEGDMGDYYVQSAEVGGAWEKTDAAVYVEVDDTSMFSGEVQEDLLPDGEEVLVKNGKWAFAKAAGVKYAKPKGGTEKELIVDEYKGKTNLSGMKLTYTPKTGVFKGSFKVYALEGEGAKAKLKKYTANVTGFVIDGIGKGTATVKKPAASWSVSVE